jgi:PleD family two-component response regulator
MGSKKKILLKILLVDDDKLSVEAVERCLVKSFDPVNLLRVVEKHLGA